MSKTCRGSILSQRLHDNGSTNSEIIISKMDASLDLHFFGPQSDPRTQIGLPATIIAGKSWVNIFQSWLINRETDVDKCIARVFTTKGTDVISWYEVWGKHASPPSFCFPALSITTSAISRYNVKAPWRPEMHLYPRKI